MKSSVLCCILFSSIFLFNFVYSEVSLSSGQPGGVGYVTFVVGKTIEISCNVSAEKNKKVDITWKKDEIPLEEVESLNDRFKISSKGSIQKLEITKATEEDIGTYACALEPSDKGFEFNVFVKPTVKVPANVNTVELEKLRIVCVVHGKPHPEITWVYSNDTMNMTDIEDLKEKNDRISLEKDTDKNIENAVLVIEGIQLWERGEYTCIGQPPFGHPPINDTTYVRTKDKYAALWPFIGICAEVFVLCAIILIYEKKRNKTELDESDTDQSPDQKNTPDHNKDSNLRHRQ